MSGFTIDIPDHVLDTLVGRVLERLEGLQRDEGGWLRGAAAIAAYVAAPESRIYALSSAKRIPVHHDGSALVAKRSELDAWMLAGGGLRP